MSFAHARPVIVSSTQNVNPEWDVVAVNTTSGAVTLTLPSEPLLAAFTFKNWKGSNNLTIARNGNKIDDAETDLTIAPGDSVRLVGINSTDWIITQGGGI